MTFSANQKVPELHREILGGTVGGALIKDKLFGYLGYQHLHVSDQEMGYSRFSVPVGLSDDRSIAAWRRGQSAGAHILTRPSPITIARSAHRFLVTS